MEKNLPVVASRTFSCGLLFVMTAFLLSLPPGALAGDDNGILAECVSIANDAERLQCYDERAGRGEPEHERGMAPVPAAPFSEDAQAHSGPSLITRDWDLDTKDRKHSFVLRPYRPNYFLPLAYNSSPNKDANLDFDPRAKAQSNEVKFQVSFKVKIWEDVLAESLKDIFGKKKASPVQTFGWAIRNSASGSFTTPRFQLLSGIPITNRSYCSPSAPIIASSVFRDDSLLQASTTNPTAVQSLFPGAGTALSPTSGWKGIISACN